VAHFGIYVLITVQIYAGCGWAVLSISKFLTLYDELRQQRSKKDGFRQTDKTAADLCRRRRRHHRADRQVDGVFDPDKLLPSSDASDDG